MARFFVDHNVARETALALQRRGHNAVTASDVGQARASDARLLLAATQQGRVLVTHDSHDFLLLHDAWGSWFAAFAAIPAPKHTGILIIPQQDYRRGVWLPEAAGREVDDFVAEHSNLTGQLYEWTPSRGWFLR